MALSSKRELARAAPAGFAWYASRERWIPARHLIYLSKKIIETIRKPNGRLMVFEPPRHGKSELISRYTPAWYLGTFPDNKVMLCSYADTFAASWGRRARDELKEHGPSVFGATVDPETAGGGQWQVLDHEGIMVTAGVGGGITGKGADLLIIDDPVKNAGDAASATIQESQHDWYRSTARTRLQPGASVILVMTRWHEADLAGRLIQDWMNDDGDAWDIISMPALAEATATVSYPPAKSMDLGPDPLGRDMDEPLWPEFFDTEALASTKKALGTYWFNALYQQRPSAAEGNLFKRKNFRYYTRRDAEALVTIHHEGEDEVFDPAYRRAKFCTVDTAATEKTTADYTVVSTWLVTVRRDMLLWARSRAQFEGPEVKAMIRLVYRQEKPGFIAIEKASVALDIIQELVREGLPVIGVVADKDKISRSLPAVARYEEHRVFHPLGPGFAWVMDEWEPELLNFPNALHDDQVDTVSIAGIQLPILGGNLVTRGTVREVRGDGDTMAGGLLTAEL